MKKRKLVQAVIEQLRAERTELKTSLADMVRNFGFADPGAIGALDTSGGHFHVLRLKRAHHVCPTCGWYGGREAVEIEPVTPVEGQR